jgi:serine/threonine protein phosphatase PrpC
MTTRDSALKSPRLYTQADLQQPEVHRFVHGHATVFTHRAPDKETVNEDCAALIPYEEDAGVLVIADGLGGQPGGETASKTAVDSLVKAMARAADEGLPIREAILNGFEHANSAILKRTAGATTLAVVELQGNTIRPYHVGDSMILCTGQRGKLKLVSVAHSPTGYAVESGMLDADEAIHHEERHLISNVVGASDMRIEIGASIKLASHDTLILASDGVFDNLYQDEIVETIRKGPLQRAGAALLQLTRQRMQTPHADFPSHPDDLTFILFRNR